MTKGGITGFDLDREIGVRHCAICQQVVPLDPMEMMNHVCLAPLTMTADEALAYARRTWIRLTFLKRVSFGNIYPFHYALNDNRWWKVVETETMREVFFVPLFLGWRAEGIAMEHCRKLNEIPASPGAEVLDLKAVRAEAVIGGYRRFACLFEIPWEAWEDEQIRTQVVGARSEAIIIQVAINHMLNNPHICGPKGRLP